MDTDTDTYKIKENVEDFFKNINLFIEKSIEANKIISRRLKLEDKLEELLVNFNVKENKSNKDYFFKVYLIEIEKSINKINNSYNGNNNIVTGNLLSLLFHMSYSYLKINKENNYMDTHNIDIYKKIRDICLFEEKFSENNFIEIINLKFYDVFLKFFDMNYDLSILNSEFELNKQRGLANFNSHEDFDCISKEYYNETFDLIVSEFDNIKDTEKRDVFMTSISKSIFMNDDVIFFMIMNNTNKLYLSNDFLNLNDGKNNSDIQNILFNSKNNHSFYSKFEMNQTKYNIIKDCVNNDEITKFENLFIKNFLNLFIDKFPAILSDDLKLIYNKQIDFYNYIMENKKEIVIEYFNNIKNNDILLNNKKNFWFVKNIFINDFFHKCSDLASNDLLNYVLKVDKDISLGVYENKYNSYNSYAFLRNLNNSKNEKKLDTFIEKNFFNKKEISKTINSDDFMIYLINDFGSLLLKKDIIFNFSEFKNQKLFTNQKKLLNFYNLFKNKMPDAKKSKEKIYLNTKEMDKEEVIFVFLFNLFKNKNFIGKDVYQDLIDYINISSSIENIIKYMKDLYSNNVLNGVNDVKLLEKIQEFEDNIYNVKKIRKIKV